jgi:hypothetical protein
MFCRSLFVLLAIVLSVPLWLQIMITPLVSSKSSYPDRTLRIKWLFPNAFNNLVIIFVILYIWHYFSEIYVGELRCSGRESSSCYTSGTRRVNLVKNPVISHEWGKDREVFTTSGIYPWLFVTQIFRNGQLSHLYGDRKTLEVMTST